MFCFTLSIINYTYKIIKEKDKTKRASHKCFNGNKYYMIRERWRRTHFPLIPLSHDVWNFYNPSDRIEYNDGQAIHHINGDKSDDRIENLQKMTRAKHTSLHHKGISINSKEKNPNWKGGVKYKLLSLDFETIEKGKYYQINQSINSLGEIRSSYFNIYLK